MQPVEAVREIARECDRYGYAPTDTEFALAALIELLHREGSLSTEARDAIFGFWGERIAIRSREARKNPGSEPAGGHLDAVYALLAEWPRWTAGP